VPGGVWRRRGRPVAAAGVHALPPRRVRRRVAAARTRDMPAPPCPARPHLILRKLGMGNCLPTAAHLPSTSLDWSRHFSASQNRVLFRRKQSVALSCFHFRRAGLLARTLRPAARRLARRRRGRTWCRYSRRSCLLRRRWCAGTGSRSGASRRARCA
jgi:hypothetical protein